MGTSCQGGAALDSTGQLLSEEKVQQLEIAGESDYSDSEVQCMVCEPEG